MGEVGDLTVSGELAPAGLPVRQGGAGLEPTCTRSFPNSA